MATINEGDRVIVVVDGSDQEGIVKRVGREGRALVVELANKQLRTCSAELARKVNTPTTAAEGKTERTPDAQALVKSFNETQVKLANSGPPVMTHAETKALLDEKATGKPRKKKDPKTTVQSKAEEALNALPEELKGKVVVGAHNIAPDVMTQADQMSAEAQEKLKQFQKPAREKKTVVKNVIDKVVTEPVKNVITEQVAGELAIDKDKRDGVLKRGFEMGIRNTDIANMMNMKRRRVSQIRWQLVQAGMNFPAPGGRKEEYEEAKKQFAILLK